MNDSKLDPITVVIEAEDFDWLLENVFPYFCAVEDAVNRGATPQEIYRHMMRQTHDGRQGLAVRCRNAASHMIRIREDVQTSAIKSQFINAMTS